MPYCDFCRAEFPLFGHGPNSHFSGSQVILNFAQFSVMSAPQLAQVYFAAAAGGQNTETLCKKAAGEWVKNHNALQPRP